MSTLKSKWTRQERRIATIVGVLRQKKTRDYQEWMENERRITFLQGMLSKPYGVSS